MADKYNPGRSSPSPRLPALLLIHLLCSLRAAHGGDVLLPTEAALSTRWTSTPAMPYTRNFGNGSQVRPVLVPPLWYAYGYVYACGFYCRGVCGFYCGGAGDSFLFAVVVVPDSRTSQFPQVVRAANRDRPVREKATLQLGFDGDLVLTDADGTNVWSSGTSGKPVAGLNLTESGNLVLFGGDKKNNQSIWWESFAHPTDSLLPGQKLRVGQSLKANDSATNSTEDLYYHSVESPYAIFKSDPATFHAYYKSQTTDLKNVGYLCMLRLENVLCSAKLAAVTTDEDGVGSCHQNPPTPRPPTPSRSRKTRVVVILVSALGSLFLLLLCLCSCCILVLKKKIILREKEMDEEGEEEDLEQVSGAPRRFSLEELRVATGDFCKKLGQGGFGSVYEGRIDEKSIAVKRLDGAGQGRKEFLAEVQTLGKIHHVNLVKLVGYCAEKSCRLLVYEFMPNGSLDRWIFSRAQPAVNPLDWQTRCKILLGVAKGISYLHEDCSQKIVHLDIKPHNILLDDRFEAKVSDFGLAKLIDRDLTHVVTRMRGTLGYLAPEWVSSGITEKVDVYSFGVVVLETVCGRRNLDRSQPEEDALLVNLLKRKAEDGELLDLVDESIKKAGFHNEEAMKMFKIAMWCLQDKNKRPSMSTVVKALESGLDVETIFLTSSMVEWNVAVDVCNSAPLSPSLLSAPR